MDWDKYIEILLTSTDVGEIEEVVEELNKLADQYDQLTSDEVEDDYVGSPIFNVDTLESL